MKEYDMIVIGTGSAMEIVDAAIRKNTSLKVAVIDKDEPGGICLTRGCIPSKILMYPAELVRTIERASEFGINTEIEGIDFEKVIMRMRSLIDSDVNKIREGLSHSKNIDYYPFPAEFTAPYTLRIGDDAIRSEIIILGSGSKPTIPQIKGLENVDYHTSDTILRMKKLPESIAIVGGGYIAAEYGHFLAAMGSKVTIIGRNPQFLPDEEPEVSALARRELGKHLEIITNHEVREAEKTSKNMKKLVAVSRENGKTMEITSEEILVAAGRGPNTDVLKPEKGGIQTDRDGWIIVNDYLETSQPNVWALGDANGKYPFKHKANYEALVIYYNVFLKRGEKVDYHAVPHAVFTYPEIASVGLREKEAVERYGEENVLIGVYRYEDTAKGEAMGVKDYFVKAIVEKGSLKILGAHIIGPHASVLIHEIINSMYTPTQGAEAIISSMHIHPALNEVVQRAFASLAPPEVYHHVMEHHYELPLQ